MSIEKKCKSCIHYMTFEYNNTENELCLLTKWSVTGQQITKCNKFNSIESNVENAIENIKDKEIDDLRAELFLKSQTIEFSKQEIVEIIKGK